MKFFLVFFGLAVAVLAAPQFDQTDVYKISGRIVAGKEAVPHSAPYIISIQDDDGFNYCGGVLIDSKTVITAGHCGEVVEIVNLIAGAHDLSEDSAGTQRRKISKVIIHPKFSGGLSSNDIAIIFPDSPFELSETVGVALLPTTSGYPVGEITMFGWGSTSSEDIPNYPTKLQTDDYPIMPMEECLQILKGSVLDPVTNFCTAPLDPVGGSCLGDSGGPLVQGSGADTIVVGLFSWLTLPCGYGPSVATRVGSYLDWIAENRVSV